MDKIKSILQVHHSPRVETSRELINLKDLSEKAGESVKRVVKQWESMRKSNHRQFKGKSFVLDLNIKNTSRVKLTVDSISFIKNEMAEIK